MDEKCIIDRKNREISRKIDTDWQNRLLER